MSALLKNVSAFGVRGTVNQGARRLQAQVQCKSRHKITSFHSLQQGSIHAGRILNISTNYYSTKNAVKEKKDKGENDYSKTMFLPKTAFALRANAAVREAEFRKACAEDLYFWQLKKNPGDYFVLNDGPPYANGDLHFGHFTNKVLKDIVNRYHIIKGRKVLYIPGWDCHGLPIEHKVVSMLKAKKESYNIDRVRKEAKKLALNTVKQHKKEFKNWGIVGDWDNSYKTLDVDYEIRELKVFREMVRQGLIKRENSPVYWSPSSNTALAESELEYNDKYESKSAYIRFEANNANGELDRVFGKNLRGKKVSYLVWTTTPWTYVANKAVAVSESSEYVLAQPRDKDEYFVVAAELVEKLNMVLHSELNVISDQIMGQRLVGLSYLHGFTGEMHPIIASKYVVMEKGTGLVHTAPGHGKEDFEVCKEHGIGPYSPVDGEGRFTEDVGAEYAGKFVLGEGNEMLLDYLKTNDLLVQTMKIVHSYPIDWRTKQPIVIRATPQWFVDISELKLKAADLLDKEVGIIVPESGKTRLTNFVKSRNNWCISRQRPWGTPIPVLYEEGTDEPLMTLESIDHIIDVLSKNGGSEAWFSIKDENAFIAPMYRESLKESGKKYYRKNDTLDVWFDSGTSWTMLQERLRAVAGDNEKVVDRVADVYLEGSDQHRGWFQSSLVLSTAVEGRSPFKVLYTHGFLLDEKGEKMSKSIGNVISPMEYINGKVIKQLSSEEKKGGNIVIPAYGVDVLRLWVGLHDTTTDVMIGPQIISIVSQQMRKLRGAIRFILGNLHKFDVNTHKVKYEDLSNPLDRYMLDRLQVVMSEIVGNYNGYMFYKGMQSLFRFLNTTCSALYFDVVKDRLYADTFDSASRLSAVTVLYHILNHILFVISPITPHFAQEVYQSCSKVYQDEINHENESVFGQFDFFKNNLAVNITDDASIGPTNNWINNELENEFNNLLHIRSLANASIETLRTSKVIGSSLEAEIEININDDPNNQEMLDVLRKYETELPGLFLVSKVNINPRASGANFGIVVHAKKTQLGKCARCWRYSIKNGADTLCPRCIEAIN